MKVRDRSLPYPVLTPFRDDISPNTFTAILKVTSDPENYYLDVTFGLENKTLLNAIANKTANYGVHVESSGNYFRQLYAFQSSSQRITIPSDSLYGMVEVSFFVVSAAEIPEYKVEGAHADYAGASFEIKLGDILALAPTATFDAFKDSDSLAKLSSIMKVESSEEDEGPFTLDLEGDKIVVYLSKKDYQRYGEMKGGATDAPILSALIVVPVLVEAIHRMRSIEVDQETEELISKRWFRVVKKKLESQGINYRDVSRPPVVLAQRILVNPLNRALAGLYAAGDRT